MVGRFSWCTTVVALVVLLLFVTTEGLRERSQLDDPKTTNRGTLRYHSKSLEEATTASTSTSRSRTARDRSVQSKRFSNLERSNEVSTQPSVIDFESKFDSTKNSIVRTTRTTERDISATEIKNDSRRASSRKVTENVKSVDSPINRRNGKRYFSETNEEAKLKDDNDQTMGTTKGISRRTFNRKSSNSSTERLDNKGPSVFLATTESSRSRTGRKIQTTYSMKDLKTQIPTSRRYTNKKFEDETTTVSFKRGRSTTERIEKSTRSGRSKVINTKENNSIQRRGPDPLLSESESVRVDIPLAVDTTQNPVPDVTTTFGVVASQRRSDVKESSKSNGRTGSSERSKNRGRLNDSETAGSSRSASRRGSSKFSDSTTAENNEQIVSSRRNTISRDRSRSSDTKRNSTTESRSRSRGRNLENNGAKNGGSLERDVKRKVAGERNSERRSRISEAATRIIENQDGQDTRGRSKGRMSRTDTTTPIITDVTTIVALDTTISNNDVTTTDSEVMATTIKPITSTSSRISVRTTSSTSSTPITESSGRGRGRGRNSSQGRKSKEDFFNHGLGFRGRKVLPEGFLNDTTDWRKSSRNEFQSHGNPGWTLRRRPAHLNNFENSSGTSLLSAREQTNEVIPPNEQSTTDIVTTESFSSRRGFKKLQTTEESSTMAGTTTKSYRRGNKTFGLSKTIAEDEESDNYPPEFKAKLKNINTKIPAPKTTSRTPLEEQRKNNYGRRSRKNSMAVEPDDLETAASANILTDESLIVNPLTLINGTGLRRVKKSSASLFAERSRKKLELARRLVKPELNIEENDLDATTASSFSKPKPTGVPVVDETSKVAKYAKPKATGGRNRTSTPLQTSWEEASVKASKLSSPRKGLEDSSKVTGRPYNLSKGRIIGEQIVTSISVEETPIEETTKPYANLPYTNPSIIGFAEEGAATTVDSTRIRPGNARGGKKSREESSVSSKNAKVSLYSTRRAEDIEPVTTIKPKKSYFSRNSKLQEQSTTVEQNSTTSKKSYGSAQRKSQAFQEEDLSKKSKFGSGVTKPTFRPRYIKRTKDKFLDERTTIDQPTIITKIPVPTSRYSRKKSAVKSVDDKSKSVITEGSQSQTKKLEFRPRTATYRRHSEVPTTLVGSTPKIDGVGVAITPRSAKYHATLKTSTVSSQSVGQEPQVNLRIANESAQETTGITGSSNGDSGNSNIFNPTKSTILAANNTLLEQLRSTVAPLLNSLGNRTPVFSGSYSNVNNANSSPRITPNGQPPRFSARYKGAELFVRKQNNIYQPTVPSVTSSSTTPVTPIENTGSAPPIDVSNPGQSKFLTLYQALESASIRNEQLLRNMSGQQQEGRQVGMVPQVDSNAIAVNVTGDNANNNATSPTVATTGPQTPDTTLNTIQDSTQTPRLPEDTENSTPAVTTGAPETPSTTEPVFTSTEPSSSTEQPTSTSTELFSSTEQVSTSTDSSSTGEQISTGGDSMSVTEQTTIETISRVTDATTMSVGGAEDIQTSAMVDNGSSSTEELVSSSTDISATTSAMTTMNPVSTTLMITSSAPQPATRLEESSTVGSNDAQSTVEQSTVGDVSSTTIGVSQDTVETSTVTSASSTFKNPETNTIPFSDTIATQTIDASSTDAPTTEADSNNMIDVETTTAIPVSTIRNRLIDFAQDILSRLQASLSTTVPSVDSTTFSPELTEISNQTISSNNRSLESLSQMKEETTLSSVTMDQSSLRNEEITTQSADTTSTTAQGTAGSGVGQTTEITTPTIQDSSTVPSSTFESSASSSLSTDSTVSSSVETTTTTTTTTMTSTERVPDGGTSTLQTTRMDVFTVTPVTETTTTVPTTTVNIEENLISTGPTSTTETTTTTVSSVINGQGGTNDATSIAPESTTSSETTNAATTIASSTSPSATPSSQTATTPYLGRFGGSRLTPAPRFSLSSTTKAPLRDYLVYGIYPNKTIVRKRPEDNLIDARNVDSPYVIFGIFPDGRLVRKFPNGTIIPDPPRSPVEVVFSLSTTTTTNRPPPRPYYNQANQGTYNQYRGPVYYNNGIPVAEPMRNVQSPGTVDLGLTGNAIVGPNGGGPDNTGPLGTPASTNEMSNALLNTQMGTASVTPIVSTGRPPTVLQGGRIVQDRERDEATRTKEAGGQRSSVYIGQDKFVNYWTNGASTTNPRALSVNINSVASAANVGPSPSVPSFDNLLNNQPGNQVTAPPGFPWRDPLDQIFGITTSSPVITASVASNTLDDTMESNNPALPRPINPYVEVFTPFSSVIGVPRGNIGTIPPPPVTTSITSTIPISTTSSSTTTTTSMTNAPMTTTTTTMAPTTTTSTTTMAPTTTTTMAPTTTTTTTTMASTTTTMAPTTTSTTTTTAASTSEPATATQTNVQMMNLLNRPQQNAFGTSIDDLVFLNSLLQNDSRNSTQRTLTQVEQLLANKILSLALNQAGQGSTRAPKAISIENATPNSIFESASTSRPIVIDLSPSTTTTTTWKTAQTQKSTDQKSIISGSTPEQLTWKPVITTTSKKDVETNTVSTSSTAKISQISTTKAPATMKVKSVTTSRPRTTTTQAPLGFGSLLWQTLFGGGLFASTTTPKPVKAKSVKTTPKSVDITPKPIQTTQKLETITVPSTTTLKTVDISKIQVSSPNSIIEDKLVASSIPISTTKKPLINNPNPRLPNVVTSTYSPEEDAKFLVELLRAVEQDNKAGSSKKTKLTQDDESFLRAILNGRGLTTTMPSSTTEISNAALLAALLKAQGIEPSTPATNIREQLQLAGLGQSVTESTAAKPATITTRPASSGATRPTDTTKKTVTPRPTSAPRIRTTTWSPSSTYPPSLFSSFSNYGTPVQSPGRGDNSGNSALFGATRAFSQFLGAAISGAAQQLQSLVRNGTRIVSEVMG
ncbi:mucin-5AC isoform X8 [Apis cerana]|uniref:mucin-5AC isoform X8 n=1 Tax=Apis cerana TaxID=7461 RepID=UPI002B237416|nr:mucin-5AC isoform X8 [Apis cerana]